MLLYILDSSVAEVEREGLDENTLIMSGYEPRLSHRLALKAWLPTFYISTQPDGGRPPPPKLALAPMGN